MNDYLSLAEVAKTLPGRPSTTAVWRWCRYGLKAKNGERVYLKHITVGRNLSVRKEDLDEFFREKRDHDLEYFRQRGESNRPAQGIPARTVSDRNKAADAASRRLAASGL